MTLQGQDDQEATSGRAVRVLLLAGSPIQANRLMAKQCLPM